MIAIILAAGKGSRLASFYSCSSKCMLPFQGKPLLERTLYRLSHCNELEKFTLLFVRKKKKYQHILVRIIVAFQLNIAYRIQNIQG